MDFVFFVYLLVGLLLFLICKWVELVCVLVVSLKFLLLDELVVGLNYDEIEVLKG